MIYPRISIITPNYNMGKYLEDTIISVISQNYPNLEYIIIDGGSSDNSLDIIKKYEDQLAFWITERDNGMYDAIQKGFDNCTGEIMAWLNSDDMYHKSSFFTVAELFTSFPNINWITGANTYYDESGKTVISGKARKLCKFDVYNHDYKWIQQESVFWRRSLWDKAGSRLDQNLRYAGDLSLWLKFFQYEKLYTTSALIGGFRLRSGNQISRNHAEDYLNEVDIVLNNNSINREEKRKLQIFRIVKKIESILNYLKIFRKDIIIQHFFKKYFSLPSEIIFDQNKMKFVLID